MKLAISLVFAQALCAVFCGAASAGYSHGFFWLRPPDRQQLSACVAAMRRVVEAAGDKLAGPDGEGAIPNKPLRIEFNGQGADSREPFIFPGAPGYNSCNTHSRPYDAAVTACLIVARDHFPADVLRIESDGEWVKGDWRDGEQLYRQVFGRRAANPISEEAEDPAPGYPEQQMPDEGWGPVSIGVLVAIGLGVAWLILRPHWSLVVEIVNSKVERVRGNGKRRMLIDIDDISRQSEIRHGFVRELHVAGIRRLFITGDISPESRQRIRNTWVAHQMDRRT